MTEISVAQEQSEIDASAPVVVYACENSAWRAWNELVAAGLQAGRNVQVLEVPCSGRVDEVLILQTIQDGVRGVLVLGCPEDSCRYLQGNLRADKRSDRAAAALQEIDGFAGLVEYESLSGTSPDQLLQIVAEFANKLDKLVTKEAVEQ